MCLYGEGVGCKVLFGRDSDCRLRHGLGVKSTLESDENFGLNQLESDVIPRGSKIELKIHSIGALIRISEIVIKLLKIALQMYLKCVKHDD
jgi:hypothetical protein